MVGFASVFLYVFLEALFVVLGQPLWNIGAVVAPLFLLGGYKLLPQFYFLVLVVWVVDVDGARLVEWLSLLFSLTYIWDGRVAFFVVAG